MMKVNDKTKWMNEGIQQLQRSLTKSDLVQNELRLLDAFCEDYQYLCNFLSDEMEVWEKKIENFSQASLKVCL